MVNSASNNDGDGRQFGSSKDDLCTSGKRNTVAVDERYHTFCYSENSGIFRELSYKYAKHMSDKLKI